ncbi:anti-repressor SinI family protein [Bacillus sp. sid0103]|nr:anti-repressor SinI family protein [Bacillus sp. sid0103]MBV7506361.1 anti-repressor SinI family protein [Bacillus sp. sid0103]
MTESKVDVIDQEWIALILEAKDLGLSIEAVRDFLVNKS